MTSWSTVVFTSYSMNLPLRSGTISPAARSTARCREMVGQLLSKASAISPDERRRSRSRRRMRRRVGSASARNARFDAMTSA